MVETPYNFRESIARVVWSTLEAGLVFCVWRGFPFLASGQISVTDMLDVFCKVETRPCNSISSSNNTLSLSLSLSLRARVCVMQDLSATSNNCLHSAPP